MLILTDLDDTLFQTARKCPEAGGELAVMSHLANGEASGYATERQQRVLAWLSGGHIVPVTARSRDVLARVNIRQTPAICAHGGCIITEDGTIHEGWHAHLTGKARDTESVAGLHARIAGQLPAGLYRHWILQEGELDLYVVIKSNLSEDGQELADVAARLAALIPAGWRTHRNGNNLAYLPPWLNKRDAAKFLIERFRAEDAHLPVIGIGDSHSDIGFMDLCDFAMTPTTSQIWRHLARENGWC